MSSGEGCWLEEVGLRVGVVRWFCAWGAVFRGSEVESGLLSPDSKARTGYCRLYEFRG